MAVTTAWKRWVKVAQPRPYSPGSEVMILTMTSREPAGWVTMTSTSLMVTGMILLRGLMGNALIDNAT